MQRKRFKVYVHLILLGAALTWGINLGFGQKVKSRQLPTKRMTQAERKAAAKRAKAARLAAVAAAAARKPGKGGMGITAHAGGAGVVRAAGVPTPGGTPDYFGLYPNWAVSPLPRGGVSVSLVSGGSGYSAPIVNIIDVYGTGSGASATATLTGGVVTGITVVTPGSGYTAPSATITDPTGTGAAATASLAAGTITGGIRKFIHRLPGLGAANANDIGQYIPVAIPDTTTYPGNDYYEIELGEYTEQMHSDLIQPTRLRGYRQTNTTDPTVSKFHYLGPLIAAQRDRPVRVKFTNNLPVGAGGNLFLPVDATLMGAGAGPQGGNYTQNRATIHLHGATTPWISDGTTHQWITPAGESTQYPNGVSVYNVPDMPNPGAPGSPTNPAGSGFMTFYYTNQQSGRLMFYHDHASGITRLNVYAGEAAGYLLADPVEQGLVSVGTIPADQVPLIIQDKTFVDPSTLAAQDPTWSGSLSMGSLWFPHVYMPNQNPFDMSGANPMGRWDYGPWFWPPFTGLQYGPVPNPYYDPLCVPSLTTYCGPPQVPGTPNPSNTPESFMDTPVINGTPYPYLDVEPKAYRFRILNASDDRFWNLQLYKAATSVPAGCPTCVSNSEVELVPFDTTSSLTYHFPASWGYLDGREGGVPNPANVGPPWIQIGTEGGLLPKPAVIPSQPVNYNYNRRDIVVLNVQEKSLFLAPAERADVIVDFSAYAGQTLILYNDAPAPVPASDPRADYYTGKPDQTLAGDGTGGSPTTLVGFGPNTRTIMQIRVGNLLRWRHLHRRQSERVERRLAGGFRRVPREDHCSANRV